MRVVFCFLGALALLTHWSLVVAGPDPTSPSFWSGWSPTAQFQGEIVSNLNGGLAVGSVGNALFTGGFSWSGTKADAWKGGKIVVNFLAADTGDPESYVRDIQGVSNLTTTRPLLRLYRLYFRQQWDCLTLRMGLLNANDYFDNAGVAGDLLNASFGIMPVLSTNLPAMATYPYSNLGTMIAVGASGTRIQAGIFGADAIHPWQQPFSQGALELLEIDQSGNLGIGRYTVKLGALHNHQNAARAAGLGPDTSVFYGIGECRWRTGAWHWGAFLQGGGAPKPVNLVPWYIGGGLRLTGIIPSAREDAFSLGISRASLRNLPHTETSYEMTGVFTLFDGVQMQPDLQLVTHPGGNLPTALVGILRLNVDLVELFGS